MPHYSKLLYQSIWFDCFARISSVLPRRFLRAAGKLGGILYALTHPQKTIVVKKNLQLLQPNVSVQLVRDTYANFGTSMADYFYIGTRPRSKVAPLIDEKLGYDYLKQAWDAKKGALLLTPHLSLFELGGWLMTELGFPSVALTLPEHNVELTQWRKNYRQRWGMDTLEISTDPFSFLSIGRYLSAGKFVVALFDRPDLSSFPIRLPHGTASFSSGILLLASALKCPVMTVTVACRPDSLYTVQANAPFLVENKGSKEETIRFYLQKITDEVTPVLQKYPSQWYQFVPLMSSTASKIS